MTVSGKYMQKTLERKLLNYPRPFLTDGEIKSILGGSADSRYGKVKRLLKQGKLLHIRRGLYCITEELGYQKKPHPYELAQFIYGPSYISLESAFSYHGLIPEAVYTTTSVATKRAKDFTTPLGVYSYKTLPLLNFYSQVELVKENDYQFFMAKPWKAICDYIYCYKKDCASLEPFIESLRFNLENLPRLSAKDIQDLDEYYSRARITRFLTNMQSDTL